MRNGLKEMRWDRIAQKVERGRLHRFVVKICLSVCCVENWSLIAVVSFRKEMWPSAGCIDEGEG